MIFNQYMDYKRSKGIKEITIETNIYNWRWIKKSAREYGLPNDVHKWTGCDMAKLIGYMTAAPNTAEMLKSLLEGYFRFVGREVEIPMLVNRETVNAKWISTEDVVKSIMNATDPIVRMILHLGGNYGLRRGEMSRLRVEDIGPDFMIVHGKGHGSEGKIRKVMLMDNDNILKEYLEWRESQILTLALSRSFETYEDRETGIPTQYKKGPLLFLKKTEKKQFVRMSPQMVGLKSRQFFRENDINASTHSLRREFVTSAYRSGVDIVTIMQIVGHEDSKVTMKYIEKDENLQKSALNKRNQYISNIAINVQSRRERNSFLSY